MLLSHFHGHSAMSGVNAIAVFIQFKFLPSLFHKNPITKLSFKHSQQIIFQFVGQFLY
jgi:hypothetical protein